MVTIVDPHIKRDPNYAVHKEATSRGLYIKDKDGKVSFERGGQRPRSAKVVAGSSGRGVSPVKNSRFSARRVSPVSLTLDRE